MLVRLLYCRLLINNDDRLLFFGLPLMGVGCRSYRACTSFMTSNSGRSRSSTYVPLTIFS